MDHLGFSARTGHLLLTRSITVASIVVAAFVLNRLVRWTVRRVVGGLERHNVQQRIDSIRARTPRALLAATDPLPALRRVRRLDAIGAVIANVGSVVIGLVACIAILQALGFRLGPLLAGAGLVGLALSLSAQQMVRDVLSGIAMLVEDQYGPGEVIDTGQVKGEVERIGLRTTQVRGVDGTVWHVRNGEIERLGNESRDWARVLLDVAVARGADLTLARRTVEAAALELHRDERWQPFLLEAPSVWGVEELATTSVVLRLAVRTRPSKRDEVARELRARVEAALERAGVVLPVPTEALMAASLASDRRETT